MKRVLMILLLLVPIMSAVCEENQIDINTASLEELDQLYGIGPVKAQAIIDSRPFTSIDDLLKVYGIGEATLQQIKNQGLACVENEKETDDEKDNQEPDKPQKEESSSDNNSTSEASVTGLGGSGTDEQKKSEAINPKPIILTSQTQKTINTEKDFTNLTKADYTKYGFVIFCIFIGILLLLKRKPKEYQTEFDEATKENE